MNSSVRFTHGYDVIEVFFTDNRPCLSSDLEDGIIVRTDPETGELVSLSFIGLMDRLRARGIPAVLPKA